jgi:hypothetical protein
MKHLVKVLIGGLCLVALACERNSQFGNTPTLEWRSAALELVGDSIDNRQVFKLKIYFTDGDGNVGSADENNSDTCDINNYAAYLERYDLFIYYFEKVNGRFEEVFSLDSCFPFHNILPNLTPVGQNKTLEGDIITPFEYSNFPENRNTDTVRFEFVLKDRSGNESNREVSEAIAIN